MKKLLSLVLALALAASLCACTALKTVEGDPNKPADNGTDVQNAEPSEQGGQVSEMDTALEALGSQVIVDISKKEEFFKAPDGTDQTILTFSYDTATAHIEGNDAASERINGSLAVLEETFYSGTGMGDGVNGMLEQATDNYGVALQTGDQRPLEFTSSRSAFVTRSDSRVLSLVYETQVYNGGAHGTYHQRAYVFDTRTGERMTFSSLCDSAELTEAMKAYIAAKMYAMAIEPDSGVDLSLFPDENSLVTKLNALIREASWYLDDEGLVIFSDVYELGSYAAGIIRFRFSYDDLRDFLSTKWLPTPREGDGNFSVAYVSDVPLGSETILARVEVDPAATELCLSAKGTVYDVTVVSVNYISDDVGFYETAQHWACSYMHDCAIQLVTILPDGMPKVMIRYTSADGSLHKLLVTQSGEDGSLILTDDSIVAVG